MSGKINVFCMFVRKINEQEHSFFFFFLNCYILISAETKKWQAIYLQKYLYKSKN